MGIERWIDSEVDVSRVALTATVAVAVAAAPESATAAPCRRQGATNRRQRGQRTRLRLEEVGGWAPREVPSVRHGGSPVRFYGALWDGTKRWQSGGRMDRIRTQ